MDKRPVGDVVAELLEAGMTTYGVALKLNRAGYKDKYGLHWTPGAVREFIVENQGEAGA